MKMKIQFLKTELGDVLLKLRWEVFILSMPTVPTLGTQTMVNVVYQTCQKMLVYFYVQFISIKITNIRVPYCTRGDKTGRTKCGDDYRNRCWGPGHGNETALGEHRQSPRGTPTSNEPNRIPTKQGNTQANRNLYSYCKGLADGTAIRTDPRRRSQLLPIPRFLPFRPRRGPREATL